MNNTKKLKFFSRNPEFEISSYIKEIPKKNHNILEIGVNRGYKTEYLKDRGAFIYGLDLNILPDIKYDFPMINGNAYNLPFRNDTFDIVCSFDVIEHMEEVALFINEQLRVLKPGGNLVCGTPNLNRIANIIRGIRYPDSFPLVLGDDCVHLREYSTQEFFNLFDNFEVKNIEISHFFLGLTGIIGVTKFPKFSKKYSNYLMLKCIK